MKLVSKKQSEDLSLNADSMEFTIDTSNQMIVSILRDKLYSNKIGAVCREVSSNSRDANREAGRSNTPITITISDDNDLLNEQTTISFKDNGIGISPERISSVFLKYGSSTKRDNNIQTGGFGIGAKTPFAYSNEFLIVTVSDYKGKRIESIYQAAILNVDGKEVSQLIPISEEETEEETGTTIVVPIKQGDITSFVKESLQATLFWDVQPNYVGFESYQDVPTFTSLIEGEGCRVIYGTQKSVINLRQNDLIFIVDGIFYTFNMDNLHGNSKYNEMSRGFILDAITTYHYDRENTNPVLEFKTGELTLSASREQIELLDDNLDIIFERYMKLVNLLKLEGEKMFKDIPTTLGKATLMNRLSGNLSFKDLEEIVDKKEKMLNKYLKDIRIFRQIDFGNTYLPLTLNKFISTEKFDIFRINNGEQIRFSKKSLVTNTVYTDLDFFKKVIIVFKNESSNYQKNETIINASKYTETVIYKEFINETVILENGEETVINKEVETEKVLELRKPIFFLTPSHHYFRDGEKIEEMKNLFKEIDAEFYDYAEVEKTKISNPNYQGEKTVKDKDVEILNVRRFNAGRFHKETFAISKSQKTILDFGGEKTIVLSLKSDYKLSCLDKIRIDFNNIYTTNTVLNLSTENELRLLKEMGYEIYVIQSEKKSKITNCKFLTYNLDSIMNDILEDEEIIEDVKIIFKNSEIEASGFLTEDSYEYKRILEDETRKMFYELGGLKLEDYKVLPSMEKSERNFNFKKLNNLNYTIKEVLTLKLKDKFKTSKFEGYLSSSMLEEAKDSVKEKFPLIHLLFNEHLGKSWGFSEYRVVNSEGSEAKSGTQFINEQIGEMIKKELENLK